MGKPQSIIMSGLTMVNNKSAISNTAKSLNISEEAAFQLLKDMQGATIQLARKSKYDDLVELASRRGIR
jgi:hypothetical protein